MKAFKKTTICTFFAMIAFSSNSMYRIPQINIAYQVSRTITAITAPILVQTMRSIRHSNNANFKNQKHEVFFRGNKLEAKDLSKTIYTEVMNSGGFESDKGLYALIAVKCWEKTLEDKKEIPENMKQELEMILRCYDSFYCPADLLRHKAQAFHLMYRGEVAPIETTKTIYKP